MTDAAPTPPPPVELLPIQEFSDAGYLHEVNRRVLHPLGLALEWREGWTREDVVEYLKVSIETGGMPAAEQTRLAGHLSDTYQVIWEFLQGIGLDQPHLSGVWDCRDDPEGVYYADKLLSSEKAQRVAREEKQRINPRMDALGYWVQPVEGVIE